MKRGSARIRLLAFIAGPLCAIALAAPATAAAGHPAAPVQRAHAASVTPDAKKPALAGYFSTTVTGSSRNYDSADSSAGAVTETNSTSGEYEIVFAKLGRITGGNAEVSAASVGRTCAVVSWKPDGPDLTVSIDCFAVDGTPVEANFDVIVTQPRSAPHGVLAYDFVQHAARSYQLKGKYQYNSTRGKNAVKHLGTGRYLVAIQGPSPSGTGTVKVSAAGAAAGDCQLARWNGTKAGTLIYVDCYSDTGARQNRQFTVVYARNNNLMGRDGKTDANSTASRDKTAVYQPKVQFNSHHGARQTAVRFSKGVYVVLFAGSRGLGGSHGGDVQVTAQGGSYRHCTIEDWRQQFTPDAEVICENNSGALVDSAFTIQWVVA